MNTHSNNNGASTLLLFLDERWMPEHHLMQRSPYLPAGARRASGWHPGTTEIRGRSHAAPLPTTGAATLHPCRNHSHLRNFICRFTCYSVLYYRL